MRYLILLLAAASAAFGQPDSNVLTITASRQLNVQPDQVTLSVYVVSDPDRSLDQVLAFLQGAKIAATDLSNVGTVVNSFSSQLQWIFTPTVSFSALNATASALGGLPANGPIAVQAFYVNATASPQSSASQSCPYPSLINDAQVQAQKLAAAAGVTVGPIVSLVQGGASVVLAANQVGAFASFLPILGNSIVDLLVAPTPGPSSACTLTVRFKLGQ